MLYLVMGSGRSIHYHDLVFMLNLILYTTHSSGRVHCGINTFKYRNGRQ